MGRAKTNRYINVKRGRAVDLSDDNYYMSGWERDIARFLNLLMVWDVVTGWEYEPEEFNFQGLGYKRGPFVYRPDFALRYNLNMKRQHKKLLEQIFTQVHPGRLVYWEVKGQETGKDRSKWRRFKSHVGYPLEIIARDKMKLLEAGFKPFIPHWESHIR